MAFTAMACGAVWLWALRVRVDVLDSTLHIRNFYRNHHVDLSKPGLALAECWYSGVLQHRVVLRDVETRDQWAIDAVVLVGRRKARELRLAAVATALDLPVGPCH